MIDIDIDFKPSFKPSDTFPTVVAASMVQHDELVKHPCGQYFQHIAVDNVTGLAAIPYKDAANLGFFKIDFLHLSVLDYFESKDEIRALLSAPPDWSLLMDEQCVSKLFQINKHYELVKSLRPQSVIELADVIAMIRPNKRQFIEQYKRNKQQARPLLYRKQDEDKSSFKKSHAVAYASTIVLQLHLIKAGIL